MIKKLLIATLALFGAASAQAETLEASGSVAGFCTFSDTVAGSLAVSGTSITTTSEPETTMTQNDANGYAVTVGTISWSLPGNYGGSVSSDNLNMQAKAESVNNLLLQLDDDEGRVETMVNAGADIIFADFTGTLSSTALAGTYSASVDVTCAAAAAP